MFWGQLTWEGEKTEINDALALGGSCFTIKMSLLKTRPHGLLSKVVWMLVHMACVAIHSASSMLVTSCGGSPCRSVRRTFPTV